MKGCPGPPDTLRSMLYVSKYLIPMFESLANGRRSFRVIRVKIEHLLYGATLPCYC